MKIHGEKSTLEIHGTSQEWTKVDWQESRHIRIWLYVYQYNEYQKLMVIANGLGNENRRGTIWDQYNKNLE